MRRGFTLIECLLATVLLALVATGLAGAVRGTLSGFRSGREEAELLRGAVLGLERIERTGRGAEGILYPAAGASATDTLALRAGIDEDGDFRVNEDPPGEVMSDGRPGVKDRDDDGDGLKDEDLVGRQPGEPGYGGFVAGIGVTAIPEDDDEDGLVNEDPVNVVSCRRLASGNLEEVRDGTPRLVATGVTAFTAWHRQTPTGFSYLEVQLTVSPSGTSARTFRAIAYPSNLDRRLGARTDQ